MDYVSQVDAVQIAAGEAGNCAASVFSGFERKDLGRMYFSEEQLTKVAYNAIIMLLE